MRSIVVTGIVEGDRLVLDASAAADLPQGARFSGRVEVEEKAAEDETQRRERYEDYLAKLRAIPKWEGPWPEPAPEAEDVPRLPFPL